jgi:hypothetical protein
MSYNYLLKTYERSSLNLSYIFSSLQLKFKKELCKLIKIIQFSVKLFFELKKLVFLIQ